MWAKKLRVSLQRRTTTGESLPCIQAQGCTERRKTVHQSDHKWALIHQPSRPPRCFSISPLDVGTNQPLFVRCHLTNDSSVEGRKTTWGVGEVQQAGVTASERRGGGKTDQWGEAGSVWHGTRGNPSPGNILLILSALSFFFSPAFLFHTPHGWRIRRLLRFYLQASGAAQVTVAGCVWGMPLRGSTCPLRNYTPPSLTDYTHWNTVVISM